MDKLHSMEIFVATVDAGSFTAAAQAFDISAVMVGKHINQLEKLLGTRLLARTTRRQSLTEIGSQYYEQCCAILAQIRQAESAAEQMRSAPRGRLKITSAISFGSEVLAPALVEYLEKYPEVDIDLDLSDRLVDVVGERIDAAIRIGHLDDSSLVARPLQSYKMLICAAPAYLKKFGTPKKPADLAKHQCLDLAHWKKASRWRLKGDTDPTLVVPARLRSNNGQAIKRAGMAGLGIIMQPEMLLLEEVRVGRLVSLLHAYVPVPKPMNLIYPRDLQSTPKLRTFIDFVLSKFGEK